MSRLAKTTLAGSIVLSVGIIYTVHYMQRQEAETMYKGVLRDDERRREKMRKREEELVESQRKRELYEAVQQVPSHSQQTDS
ncbi:hypothetical protein BDY19DRAFT_899421 [Irpex rosettiformis]|uniref:Uncharacterized protein n=1 Tax=Irpex rosettiformis TaxID=378272 RepID=A0ACB8TPH8_9APHY|nr:hypothetical protein BDY19DRAFT_899421 [Irpex rosettiformis]